MKEGYLSSYIPMPNEKAGGMQIREPEKKRGLSAFFSNIGVEEMILIGLLIILLAEDTPDLTLIIIIAILLLT